MVLARLHGVSSAAAAVTACVWLYHHFSSGSANSQGSVSVTTTPAGAYLSIDGHLRGQTPLGLPVSAGRSNWGEIL